MLPTTTVERGTIPPSVATILNSAIEMIQLERDVWCCRGTRRGRSGTWRPWRGRQQRQQCRARAWARCCGWPHPRASRAPTWRARPSDASAKTPWCAACPLPSLDESTVMGGQTGAANHVHQSLKNQCDIRTQISHHTNCQVVLELSRSGQTGCLV